MVGLRGIRLPATPQNAGQGSQAWADPALVPGPRPHRPESWTAWGLWKGHKAPVPAPPHSRSRGGWATHLGCHKVGGVARCHKEPILSPQLLGKAKVTDAQALRVPRLIHVQDVAGLEVPVHDLGAEGPGQFSMWTGCRGPRSTARAGRVRRWAQRGGRRIQNLKGGEGAAKGPCCWHYQPEPSRSMSVCVDALGCVRLCNPMDCSPSGSSVHGIFQARILVWVAKGVFLTQRSNPSLLCLLRWQAGSLPLSHLAALTSPSTVNSSNLRATCVYMHAC